MKKHNNSNAKLEHIRERSWGAQSSCDWDHSTEWSLEGLRDHLAQRSLEHSHYHSWVQAWDRSLRTTWDRHWNQSWDRSWERSLECEYAILRSYFDFMNRTGVLRDREMLQWTERADVVCHIWHSVMEHFQRYYHML